MTMVLDKPVEQVDQLRVAADNKAALVGLQPGEVKVLALDWPSILRSALKVKLHIGGTTFEKGLDPEDFGLTFETADERSAFTRTIELGKVYSMTESKRSQLASVRGKARTLINSKAMRTEHFGFLIRLGDETETREKGWYFKDFLDTCNELGKEYLAIGQAIYDEWPTLMDELREDYQLIAVGNYARMKAAGTQGLGTLGEEVARFVASRMAEIEGERDAVKASFYWRLDVTDIPLAAAMAQDQAEAHKIKVAANESAAMAMIEQAKLETTRRMVGDGIGTLFKDLRAVTNGMLHETSIKVLKAIQNNGEVPGGSVRGLRNLVENLQNIQPFPDSQVDQQVTEIRRLLAAATVDDASINDDVVHVRNVMRRIAAEAKLVLIECEQMPKESTREFGVPDTLAGLRRIVGFEDRSGTRSMDLPLTINLPVATTSDERTF